MRNRYVLLADICLIPVAAFGAFALRFDLRFYGERPEFLFYVIAAVTIKPIVFYAFGLYRRYWRYTGLPDLIAVLLAALASLAVMAMFVTVATIYDQRLEFSRAVLLIDGLLTLAAAAAVRISIRLHGESRARAREPGGHAPMRRVLVVGAGQAGAMVVREMDRNRHLGMTPVGFLDDDTSKLGKQIYGVPVISTTSELPDVVQERRVDEVIIAMPTAPGSQLRSIAEQCRELNLVSRTMPGVFELLDGNVSVSRLRQIEVADLLRRAQVMPANTSVSYVAGKSVLVTGAGGSIGAELCRQLARSNPSALILLGHGENSIFDVDLELRERYPALNVNPVIADIRDMRRMRQVFTQLRPAVVLHAAAHKHVPLMEENPGEAVTNNVLGTQHVLEAALAVGTERFVMISTDKAVAPTSMMGATKRVAETLVRAAARRTSGDYVVVRFGNVLGSRGSVVPHFKRQIERGGPITLTHPDMKRFFMTIPEAVHLVLEAGGMGRGELFVLKMGAPVRIADLAQDLIRLSGFSPEEIPIVFTGIRPGEKLDEILWEDGAAVEATSHPDIVRVVEGEVATGLDTAALVKSLVSAVEQGDDIAIKAILMQQLPAFTPSLRSGTAM